MGSMAELRTVQRSLRKTMREGRFKKVGANEEGEGAFAFITPEENVGINSLQGGGGCGPRGGGRKKGCYIQLTGSVGGGEKGSPLSWERLKK